MNHETLIAVGVLVLAGLTGYGVVEYLRRKKREKAQANRPAPKPAKKPKAPKHQPSVWTRTDAHKVVADKVALTQPAIPDDFPIMSDDWFVWDTWPLMNEKNEPVKYNGWNVIFSLVAPRDKTTKNITEDFNNRHGKARIGVWISRDAKSWQFNGLLFDGCHSLGEQEWAGCTVLNKDNEITVYYTAKYATNSIPTKVTGKIHSDGEGVFFTGFRDFIHLFEADGVWYQTYEQNEMYGFRDPWFFRDPKDGKAYLLFEGNVAGVRGSHVVTQRDIGKNKEHVPDGARFQTANIGIARAVDDKCEQFELLPPLITAVGVNDQTERPHMVFKDGKVYLFTISHAFTYAEGLKGPDGVYGFVADDIFGPYKPMNGSGLVLGNPSQAPYQSYSHYVMPNLLVESFIDSTPWAHSQDKGAYRVGGTLAPTVRIELKGDTSQVVESLGYGYIPEMTQAIYRDDKVVRVKDQPSETKPVSADPHGSK